MTIRTTINARAELFVYQQIRSKISNAIVRLMEGRTATRIKVDSDAICLRGQEMIGSAAEYAAKIWNIQSNWNNMLKETKQNLRITVSAYNRKCVRNERIFDFEWWFTRKPGEQTFIIHLVNTTEE